jgi:hypothetical protein
MTSELEHCLAILHALEISEVQYWLSGGGDSGTAEIQPVLYAGGHEGPLPMVTIGITDAGAVVSLDERLEILAGDVPEGDWVNNEGGRGTVTFHPQETDPDCQVDCDMTYGEDGDFEDEDFEDEEEDFLDFDEAEPPNAIAVDDSALQPAEGDGQ